MSSSTAAIAARADQFVSQLCTALVAQLASANAAPLSSTTAIRSHLQSVYRALPTSHAIGASMREYLLQPKQLEKSVDRVTRAIEKARKQSNNDDAATDSATTGPTILFAPSDYLAALTRIDAHIAANSNDADLAALYGPLLLPATSPAQVMRHFMRSLTKQIGEQKGTKQQVLNERMIQMIGLPFANTSSTGSLDSLLSHLESLLLLARRLPSSSSSSLLALSSLLDRACTRFATLASSSQASAQQTRRFQDLVARLLVEEAKRKSKDSWTQEGLTRFETRIRNKLRRTGDTGYSGQCAML